jgi:hypothetical protein
MTHALLIDNEARRGEVAYIEAARSAQPESEAATTRLTGRWVIDLSSGRPTLRLTWRTADAASTEYRGHVA